MNFRAISVSATMLITFAVAVVILAKHDGIPIGLVDRTSAVLSVVESKPATAAPTPRRTAAVAIPAVSMPQGSLQAVSMTEAAPAEERGQMPVVIEFHATGGSSDGELHAVLFSKSKVPIVVDLTATNPVTRTEAHARISLEPFSRRSLRAYGLHVARGFRLTLHCPPFPDLVVPDVEPSE